MLAHCTLHQELYPGNDYTRKSHGLVAAFMPKATEMLNAADSELLLRKSKPAIAQIKILEPYDPKSYRMKWRRMCELQTRRILSNDGNAGAALSDATGLWRGFRSKNVC